MSTGPVDHTKHPADPVGPPRSVWLRILRLAISLVILWCLWLIYPLASVRICAARVASYYEPEFNAGTGQIYAPRPGGDPNKIRAWEERLENQPVPRLLGLLPSRDPVGIWVVSTAIERQLRSGRLVGWPGKREPVPPLDAEAAELILQVLDQELPPPALASLVALLRLVPTDLPQYREILLKATEHREPSVREFGMRVLDFMDVESDEAAKFVGKLAKDSDPQVRAALIASLVMAMRKQGSKAPNPAGASTASWNAAPVATDPSAKSKDLAGVAIPSGAVTTTTKTAVTEFRPSRYQRLLLAAVQDDDPTVRSAASSVIEVLDVDSEEVSEAVVKLWNGASSDTQWRLFTELTNQMAAGRIRQLPPKLIDVLLEKSVQDSSGRRLSYLHKVLSLPGIPADRQWQLIESELKEVSPEDEYRIADLRDALFLATERERYYESAIDWKQFRERFRPFALEAKPRLLEWATEAIKSNDETTALSGVGLLVAIAPDEPDRLTPVLSHSSARVRIRALRSLVPSAAQLPQLLGLLEDLNRDIRGFAANALRRYEAALSDTQLEHLISAYRAGRLVLTPECIQFFEEKYPGRVDLKQVLIDCLSSDSSDVSYQAVLTLQARTEYAHEAWPRLVEGIRTGRLQSPAEVLVIEVGRPIESPEVARKIIRLLLRSYPRPGGAYPPDADKCRQLLRQFTKLCPADFGTSVFLDEFVAILTSSEDTQRRAIADLLSDASIDPTAARPTKHAIVLGGKLLSDASIDPTAALPRLRDLLEAQRWETRQSAAFVLGAWGPRAKEAVGMLIERLGDPEVRVRIAACEALGAIGPDAEAAAALVQLAKNDKIPGAQLVAVEALGKMGRYIPAHRDAIEELTRRGDPMVRNAAMKVLKRQNGEQL